MAEGVRIQPRPELNFPIGAAMVVVVDHDRPFPPPLDGTPLEFAIPECRICKNSGNGYDRHFTKAYHVQLGPDGTAIVSTGVWAGLQRCADNPFEVLNPVPNPPAQHLVIPPAVSVRS
jgi:hypothetical protein